MDNSTDSSESAHIKKTLLLTELKATLTKFCKNSTYHKAKFTVRAIPFISCIPIFITVITVIITVITAATPIPPIIIILTFANIDGSCLGTSLRLRHC